MRCQHRSRRQTQFARSETRGIPPPPLNLRRFTTGYPNVKFIQTGLYCNIQKHYFDMCMSYRWRESFNTVNCQIRDVITSGIDMCGRRMRKGGGGWTIHPSRRWLISCARTAVLYVCLSIALTSCTTSMAETNLDAIRKQNNAEYSKRYRLKRKMQMQQQAPTTSEAEPDKLQI